MLTLLLLLFSSLISLSIFSSSLQSRKTKKAVNREEKGEIEPSKTQNTHATENI